MHMHQPFYKDLVSGEYRMPWVRMHALKDYYGMVKLLDEFPQVRQTFNLVPSLVSQIQDYVNATARDPFYDVIAKPAADLSETERQFALNYFFQANETNLIARYPRYAQLLHELRNDHRDVQRIAARWSVQNFADLQVFSQLAWFDECWLEDPEVAELVRKGRGFDRADQQLMLQKQRELLAAVLPAYRQASERGAIEISTTPFYHPILPLLCDTDIGRVSAPEIALPRQRFRRPEDAEEQLVRALAFTEQTFGSRPVGLWPSEGSISNEVIEIARRHGVQWMASDEGVLGRSLNSYFERDSGGKLDPRSASDLYRVYRYETTQPANDSYTDKEMSLVFRDHSLSDLIGFVYSGMDAGIAAEHFIAQVKASAEAVLASGRDAVVSVILDGENAWEHFPRSGREFLRRLYAGVEADPQLHAESIGAAIRNSKEADCGRLAHVTPGSWINANFNVWIGAPEDNRSWDLLNTARDFYERHAARAPEDQRALAHEELLIAEGSDWNWWYGPEHHTANDSDFDGLYRKHLSNVYRALGAAPPEELSTPISGQRAAARVAPQTRFIHPRMNGGGAGYFDWLGAASYEAHAQGAMHGGVRMFAALCAGFDERFFYARLDFAEGADPQMGKFVIEIESVDAAHRRTAVTRLHVLIEGRTVKRWWLSRPLSADNNADQDATLGPEQFAKSAARLTHALEVRVQQAALGTTARGTLRLRALWLLHGIPADSLPREGWMELPVLNEEELQELAQDYW
ncbi:MAG: glycoside hydrolase family 57 protein [Acidobacteriaceae bacterium]